MRRLESAETESLRLEPWDQAAHGAGLAAVCRRLGMLEEAELPHPSRDHSVKVLRLEGGR
jgi:hypothetical protein